MRIAIFAKRTLTHGLGGLEVHLEALCRELPRLGHDVQVITTQHPTGQIREERDRATIHFLTGAPAGRYSRHWWRLARQAFLDLSEPEPFRLVLSLGLGARSILSLPSRPPVYFICHGLALSHLPTEWKQCHRLREFARFFSVTLPELLVYAWGVERALLRNADGVIAVSDQVAESLRGRTRRLILAYNGVAAERFTPDPIARAHERKRLGLLPEHTALLMAGAMTEQKGMQVGLQAVEPLIQRHPALRVLLAGTGPYEHALRVLADRPALCRRCHFLGPLSHEAMPKLFQAADCFLHPSLRAEGLPTVILEAMASGLPVVASDAGGTATVVIDGETGLLVPRGDVRRLSEAVDGLLSDDLVKKKIVTQAQLLVQKQFAWPVILEGLLAEITPRVS